VSAADEALLAGALGRLRIGTGVDVHGFEDGRRLVLAGVDIPSERGLEGHSDADLVAHAVTDALLGAAGSTDIGTWFSSDDPDLAGADSMQLLARVVDEVCVRGGCTVLSADVVIAMQRPKLAPHREAMQAALARVLRVDADRVGVRATTTDGLGFVGRGEGAAATASCLVLRPAGGH
jgi:2-C-methyl-D-erythritol 2,4-cyclodiphosphate synthase